MFVTTLVLALVASILSAQPQWTPPTPKNLQVFPKDTNPRALIMTMRSFSMGLGVRCQHCHVFKGDNPDDLNAFDFASDEKAAKNTARTMIRMAMAINGEHLKAVGEPPPPGEMKVTCYTCHRGETKPLTRRPEK
jgi:hypothetical protein